MVKQAVQRFMIYLPEPTYERLRTIAFEERTSINRLVLDAVESALAKRAKGKAAKTKKGG